MRPVLAASYSQVRETPSRAATTAGFRRSGVLIGWLLTWVIDRERFETANELGETYAGASGLTCDQTI